MSLSETLRDFVQLFDGLHLPYAVMGGIAVRVYGIPRPTYDVDCVLPARTHELLRSAC
jgi:hypothetical protein